MSLAGLAIRIQVEALLAPHDAAWEKSIVEVYVARAKEDFNEWIADLKAMADGQKYSNGCYAPRYVRFAASRTFESRPYGSKACVAAWKAGKYSANEMLAADDGKRAYAATREDFLTRIVGKIEFIVQAQPVTIGGAIQFNRRIEGLIQVSVGKHFFGLNIEVKTNYRYGANSANGHLTIYNQYPATIAWARFNMGKHERGTLSDDLLAHKISGVPLDHRQRATQAEKDARQARLAEKQRLEWLRAAYSNILSDYNSIAYHESSIEARNGCDEKHLRSLIAEYRSNIVNLCVKIGITIPGSKQEANRLKKEIIAQIKALKPAKQEA